MPISHTSRTEARTVRCPKCSALPGQPCTGARGKIRESNHRERVNSHDLRRYGVEGRVPARRGLSVSSNA